MLNNTGYFLGAAGEFFEVYKVDFWGDVMVRYQEVANPAEFPPGSIKPKRNAETSRRQVQVPGVGARFVHGRTCWKELGAARPLAGLYFSTGT
jgi:hypothetical protein